MIVVKFKYEKGPETTVTEKFADDKQAVAYIQKRLHEHAERREKVMYYLCEGVDVMQAFSSQDVKISSQSSSSSSSSSSSQSQSQRISPSPLRTSLTRGVSTGTRREDDDQSK